MREINLSVTWEDVDGYLLIDKNGCKIFSQKKIMSSKFQGLEFL